MQILAQLSHTWLNYVSNNMPAMIRSLKRDPEVTVELENLFHSDRFDAVIADLEGPVPHGLPINTVRMAYTEDIHRFTVEAARATWHKAEQYDLILTPYRFAQPGANVYHWPPAEQRAKFVFFPFWVPDEPPPVPTTPRSGGIISGVTDPAAYPWRAWVKSLCLPGVDVLPHPGYDDLAAMSAARESYFATLAKYVAGVTCNAILDYTVAKYLEIPYAGCVLIAAWPNLTDIELLGFVDGVNCLFVGENNETYLRKVVTHMLSQNDAGQVAENGQQLVLHRHTASHRIAYLKRIVRWYQEHRRVPSAEEQKELFSERTT